MRRLTAIEFLTVDGVMQGLGSPEEDTEGGFRHGGWGVEYAGAIEVPNDGQGLGETTAYLFGRKTYEKMAAFWPFQPASNPMAAHLNATPKYVATINKVTQSGYEGVVFGPPVPGGRAGGDTAAASRAA